MKRILFPLFLVLAVGLWAIGCSSTTGPLPASNALNLSLVSATKPGSYAQFHLKVTQNGVGVPKAKLDYRVLPGNRLDSLQGVSDSVGGFNFVYYWADSIQSIAFQAVKDSLRSNYVVWP